MEEGFGGELEEELEEAEVVRDRNDENGSNVNRGGEEMSLCIL
jgi:hypothetical protein